MRPEGHQHRAAVGPFVGLLIVLVLIGFIFIYSASSVYALAYVHDSAYFVKKQFLGLGLGLIAAFVAAIMPLRILYVLTPVAFVSALGLTVLTLVPGLAYHIHGSSRWLRLGPLLFQPSEALKCASILYIAHIVSRKQWLVRSLVRRYFPVLCVVCVSSLILLKQPDFGSAVTIGASALILMFIVYPDWYVIVGLLVAGMGAAMALVVREPYRLKRVLAFLDPWQDPQGTGFQIIQSLIAIGSGGILGVGVSHSSQKFFYLPMQHTDFIFAIIAEETGFAGAAVLIGLYVALLYQCVYLSLGAHSSFGRYAILGFALLVSMQAIINIAVSVGLFPTKGIGLPFVSYGNSALICFLVMAGVVVRCAVDRQFTDDVGMK